MRTALRLRRAPASAAASETSIKSTGRMRWNSTRDYSLSYSPEALVRERSRFNRIILIETHLGHAGGDARRQLIFNLARGTSESEVELKYQRFLFRLFESIVQLEQLLFEIPERRVHGFLFHLGVLNFYKLVRRFLDSVDSGRLHCRESKLLNRHLPVHLIRKTLIEWWRAKILSSPFDPDDETAAREICAVVISSARKRQRALFEDEPGPMVAGPLLRFRRLHQEILQRRIDAPQKR